MPGDSVKCCPICGVRRRVRYGRGTLCQTCRWTSTVKPSTDDHALTGGRWVPVRNLRGDCTGQLVWVRDRNGEVA